MPATDDNAVQCKGQSHFYPKLYFNPGSFTGNTQNTTPKSWVPGEGSCSGNAPINAVALDSPTLYKTILNWITELFLWDPSTTLSKLFTILQLAQNDYLRHHILTLYMFILVVMFKHIVSLYIVLYHTGTSKLNQARQIWWVLVFNQTKRGYITGLFLLAVVDARRWC